MFQAFYATFRCCKQPVCFAVLVKRKYFVANTNNIYIALCQPESVVKAMACIVKNYDNSVLLLFAEQNSVFLIQVLLLYGQTTNRSAVSLSSSNLPETLYFFS